MPFMDKGVQLICGQSHKTPLGILINLRNYAARKGTRAKRAKSKVKVEVEKVGFIPHNQRNLAQFLANRPKLTFDDSWKQVPTDNVYPHKYFRWTVYSFAEAFQCLRENNHETMYNRPTATVHVDVELDMIGEKKTRFHDNFHRIVGVPHPFEHGDERSVLVFTKDPIKQEEARAAGASLVGGVELIKEIQAGALSLADFQHFAAEPAILPELVSLRGLMRRKFPSPKAGTLDTDVAGIVRRLIHGINYSALKDEYEKNYGVVKTVIGTLGMDGQEVERNFAALVKDVQSMRPKREGAFITRCLLWSPPGLEKLKVGHDVYIDDIVQEAKKKQASEKVEIEISDAVVQ